MNTANFEMSNFRYVDSEKGKNIIYFNFCTLKCVDWLNKKEKH